jgi:diguanylate cyclase (GGDEF)-like protein/PAS domain S-box-containing protein
MTPARRARLAAVDLLAGVPLVVKVGLPVLGVSIASALLLQRATTAEVLSQCSGLTGHSGSLCADPDAVSAIGARVALLATDITAMTLVALWLVLHTFVLRPTSRLARAASRVADGDLEVRIGGPARLGMRDELLRVSAEFDRMVGAIAHHERQIRGIIDTAYDAFVSADASGHVVDWSHQAEKMFGWTRTEAVGRELGGLVVPRRYRAQHRAGLAGLAHGGEGRVLGRPLELAALHRDGHEIPVELVIWSNQVDGELRFHSFLRDISERKGLEAQLTHQAFHDALTGLANRTLFQDRLEHALQRPGAGVGVIFCDLDDFKTVNDSLGHAAGDRLLLIVAERLTTAMRAQDTLARLAGDEFAVLVEDADDEEVEAIARRLLAALAPAAVVDKREVPCRASLGTATTTSLPAMQKLLADNRAASTEETHALAEELLRNADAAMYAAKQHGKDTVERFVPAMHELAVERLRLRTDLHGALERDELRLEYQPYVEAQTGRITGCEALARWDHPTRGPVSPGQFIPMAEETGLIRDLGRWVLNQACTQLAAWHRDVEAATDLTMSVNVSIRQLEDPSFVADVGQILHDTGVDPTSVVLEITESALSHDPAGVVDHLNQLKALGLIIAVDDFGTGYSSLSQLGQMPVDVIKIDRSFVSPLALGSAADSSVVTAILQIGASRNLRTVAEGVETPEQLAVLQQMGCQLIQGFLFHRPMAPDAVAHHLRVQPRDLDDELTA